jgi:tetratricopeptide (TPR) repeat protein
MMRIGSLGNVMVALALGNVAFQAAAQGVPAPPGEEEVAPYLTPEAGPIARPGLSANREDDLDELLTALAAEADPVEAGRLAQEVAERWSISGSAAMDVLLTRGRAAVEDEDWPRAIAHLTALTDHAPEFAEGWVMRATAFFLSDRYGPAISDIEQALILEPRHWGALTGLGIVMERLGEDDLALRAFREAALIYPAQEEVRAAIARLEARSGGRPL